MKSAGDIEKGSQTASGSASQKSSALPQFKSDVILILQAASSQPGTHLAGAFEKISPFIEKFNSSAAQSGDVEFMYTCLSEIEQIAYAWQCDNNPQANQKERDAMIVLLTALEENHRSLVIQSGALWIKPGTEKGLAQEMTLLWESIGAGKGNIHIDPTDREFVNFVRAGIAKLLQGPHGREILSTLNGKELSEDRAIWIGKNWQKAFANTPLGKEWREGSWAVPLARTKDPQDMRHRQSDGKAGLGTGCYVQIDISPSPLLIGRHHEPLCMPAFITLGHELGHAYHNLKGLSLDPMNNPDGYPTTNLTERDAWSEPEEYQNITQNENTLRAEHGLPKRKYHKDMKALTLVLLSIRKLALQDWLTETEGKILDVPGDIFVAVRERLPALVTISDILIGTVNDDEDTMRWTVPGQLDIAEGLRVEVEAKLDTVIAEVKNASNGDNCAVM